MFSKIKLLSQISMKGARPGESLLDLASRAALKAAFDSGVDLDSIDLVVCVSSPRSPKNFTAALLKRRIGFFGPTPHVKDLPCPVFGMRQLMMQLSHMIAGEWKRALVISCDGAPMRLNWHCSDLSPLAGESVSAAIVGLDDIDEFFVKKSKMEMYN